MRRAVPRMALDTPVGNRTVRDVAREVVALARGGLSRRANLNSEDLDETVFLSSIEEVIASGMTPADQALAAYASDWRGDIEEIFRRDAY
jgi:glutamate--cysteine ligase